MINKIYEEFNKYKQGSFLPNIDLNVLVQKKKLNEFYIGNHRKDLEKKYKTFYFDEYTKQVIDDVNITICIYLPFTFNITI